MTTEPTRDKPEAPETRTPEGSTAPRSVPGLGGILLFATIWTAAAAAARLTTPPAWTGKPAGYPFENTAATLWYQATTYMPEQIGIVLAAIAAGAALGLAAKTSDTAYRAARRRILGFGVLATLALTFLGAGQPAAGVLAAVLVLAPTCRRPENADGKLIAICATGAVAGPLINLLKHRSDLMLQAAAYGEDRSRLLGWLSDAWAKELPWTGDWQLTEATQTWEGFASMRAGLMLPGLTTDIVTSTGWLAAAGVALGLWAATHGTGPTADRRTRLLGIAALATGACAYTLESGNGWIGLGPRLAEPLQNVTTLAWSWLIVTLAATAAAASTSPADDGRWTRLVGWTTKRLPIPGRRDPRAPLSPLAALAAAAAAYTAAIGAIHLTPWTSPTPLNSGTYGQFMGGMTILAALQGAAVAGITWYAVTTAARRRQSRIE